VLNGAADKTPRRRLPGVDVRPGSVKQARADSGLSLAELAGGRVTRAAIHLIETGRSRPSMPVLEMIAERTGKPVTWFLDPAARGQTRDLDREARISELEALCEAHDYVAARRTAEGLLQVVRAEDEEGRVRHYLGRALVRLNKPDDALPHLRRATSLFEALQDELMVVETLDCVAGALFAIEDPSALKLEEDVLRRCRAMDPVPAYTEIRILTNLATVYLGRNEWQKALSLYEAILERGRELQDLRYLARIYMGLGESYRHLGDLARAVTYTQRGVAFHAHQHDQASLCNAEEQLGRLLMRQNDLHGAELHLQRAIDSARQMALPRHLCRAELAMAEVLLRRGDLETSERLALGALEAARQNQQAVTEAEAHGTLGKIKELTGDSGSADQHFKAALGMFEAAGRTEQLVDTHHAYAHVLKERGEPAAALEQLEAAMELTRPDLASSGERAREEESAGELA
jgi:tetratricopeptide (TPR) repeat protein